MIDIVGTWQLVRTQLIAADGTQLPPPYGGEAAMGRVVLSAEGRMMAVMCDGRREMPAGVQREYVSYCGNYTFDGKQLITKSDAASDPERMKIDQVRDVTFEGDVMVLRPPPVKAADGSPAQRILYWRKISTV